MNDLLEVQRDRSIDVLFVVETLHDANSTSFSRLQVDGFHVVDRPRLRSPSSVDTLMTNHGGVAVVSTSGIRLT